MSVRGNQPGAEYKSNFLYLYFDIIRYLIIRIKYLSNGDRPQIISKPIRHNGRYHCSPYDTEQGDRQGGGTGSVV